LQSLPLIGQPTAYSNGATGAGWAVAVLATAREIDTIRGKAANDASQIAKDVMVELDLKKLVAPKPVSARSVRLRRSHSISQIIKPSEQWDRSFLAPASRTPKNSVSKAWINSL
jgi:hypothetical protein